MSYQMKRPDFLGGLFRLVLGFTNVANGSVLRNGWKIWVTAKSKSSRGNPKLIFMACGMFYKNPKEK